MTTPTPTGSAPDDGSFRPPASIPTEQTVKPAGLIERLEAAEVGSRELDCEVYEMFNAGLKPVPKQAGRYFDPSIISVHGAEKYITRGTSVAPKYTTSLDAALALAGRVLPGWWWTAGKCGLTCHASVGPDRAFIAEPDLSKYDAGFHADIPNPSTPAIALCVAALKAVAATGEPR